MEALTSFFNAINSGSGIEINTVNIILSMAAALIFGILISLTYIYTHKDRHQQSFAITLTMLPIILTVIILFVGSNVARAFSLAGTLSIIRFRSAPGDPEDIGYIFFDIAAGLACGVGLFLWGAIFVILLCLVMIFISKTNYARPKSTAKQLKITIPENLDYEGVFDEILKRYTNSYVLRRVKTTDLGSLFELTYSLKMIKGADEKELIDELRTRNGNLNIVLSLAENEVYGK
ncbi:MAG: DUF4956 domain-containing protein [Clostridia bacterium]|nr:DUF4956 domain-containing protein [Clostridia bacterium]MBQ3472306.1 DUF4956 domain-containing protein [Clostridia bacterium]MBQ6530217.1 DUF4956 domain-containing protein [Clostridia bacterium]MBQ9599117.1 DUF4956 domain-containing protein [Clostridia bacterium]MBR0027108.1 DUF4956 domain-containing protein [Clostridia bacterium]